MKNFEGDGAFLSYETARSFLRHIRQYDADPVSFRDYCIVFMLLEYGWRLGELLDKRVADGRLVAEGRQPGWLLMEALCEDRRADDYLFPGRNGRKMTARNAQLRLEAWAESGGFGKINANMLVNTCRVRHLCRKFTIDSFEWEN